MRKKYIGDWLENKMHRKGVFTWSDGKKYEGDYFNDKKKNNDNLIDLMERSILDSGRMASSMFIL